MISGRIDCQKVWPGVSYQRILKANRSLGLKIVTSLAARSLRIVHAIVAVPQTRNTERPITSESPSRIKEEDGGTRGSPNDVAGGHASTIRTKATFANSRMNASMRKRPDAKRSDRKKWSVNLFIVLNISIPPGSPASCRCPRPGSCSLLSQRPWYKPPLLPKPWRSGWSGRSWRRAS